MEPALRWSEANVLAAERRWQDAFQAFEGVAAIQAEKGFRPDHGTTLCDWAEAHLARGESGDTKRARGLLGEALAVYEEMGADGWIERVKARLAELGD